MTTVRRRTTTGRLASVLVVAAVAAGTAHAAIAAGGGGGGMYGTRPVCVSLLSPATVAKVFHVPHMGAADWHTDGVAQDYCDYSPSANGGSVQDQVDPKATVASFEQQIKVGEQFTHSKPQPVPALGSHAVDVPFCVGVPHNSPGCTPNVYVLAKGYYINVANDLQTSNMKSLPEVEALIKDLIAKV